MTASRRIVYVLYLLLFFFVQIFIDADKYPLPYLFGSIGSVFGMAWCILSADGEPKDPTTYYRKDDDSE